MQLPAFEGKTACCFTGHRPNGLPEGGDEQKEGMIRLKHALIYGVEAAIQCGVTVFWAGGAAGFDMLAAEAVLAWRETYPDIRLCLALPSRTYVAQGAVCPQCAHPRRRRRNVVCIRGGQHMVRPAHAKPLFGRAGRLLHDLPQPFKGRHLLYRQLCHGAGHSRLESGANFINLHIAVKADTIHYCYGT